MSASPDVVAAARRRLALWTLVFAAVLAAGTFGLPAIWPRLDRGDALVGCLAIALSLLGLPNVWRGRRGDGPRVGGVSASAAEATQRSAMPLFALMFLLGTSLILLKAAGVGDADGGAGGPLEAVALVVFCLMLVTLGLTLSVWLFNRPRSFVPRGRALEPKEGDAMIDLPAPEGWVREHGIAGTAVAVFPDDAEPGEFRPSANVVVEHAGGEDLAAFGARQLDSLAAVLTDPVLIDDEEGTLGGLPARRLVLAHRQGIWNLTLQQWISVQEDGTAVTLSFTSESESFAALRPVAEELAAGVRVDA